MHLVALVEAEDHVCCRYRLTAFLPHLAAAGHTLQFRVLPRSWAGKLAIGRDLAHADAVILQRKVLSDLAISLLRRRVRKLIFDFDDAVWLRDSYSRKGFDDPRRLRSFRSTVRAADLIIAGNDYLAHQARRWVGPERVAVIPTCVDITHYPPPPSARSLPRASNALQLVWIGSSSTLRGLERFAPTLSAIGSAVPGTRLKLICDRTLNIPNLPVDFCPWDATAEAVELAAADVGIGWVPDDPWSRGKCGLKILQYHAAQLPVVANPVGVQQDFIRDGETGFRATTTEEWITAVRRLTVDPELRWQLGKAGRRRVEVEFSVAAGAARLISALDRLALNRKAG